MHSKIKLQPYVNFEVIITPLNLVTMYYVVLGIIRIIILLYRSCGLSAGENHKLENLS